MCLTYESLFDREPLLFAETKVVTIKKVEVAAEYERVHFIGHALYNGGVTKEALMAQAVAIENNIEQRTGYNAVVVDIGIHHYPPFMTDIDFIIDVPKTPSLGPILPQVLLAIIAILAIVAVIGLIYLFWTTYVEKVKLYYCDQCPGSPAFEGWLSYVAHLAEKHPTKYKAIQDSGSKNWWEEIPSTVKWVVGGGVAIAVLIFAAALVRK